jgi:hypothetical protein
MAKCWCHWRRRLGEYGMSGLHPGTDRPVHAAQKARLGTGRSVPKFACDGGESCFKTRHWSAENGPGICDNLSECYVQFVIWRELMLSFPWRPASAHHVTKSLPKEAGVCDTGWATNHGGAPSSRRIGGYGDSIEGQSQHWRRGRSRTCLIVSRASQLRFCSRLQ